MSSWRTLFALMLLPVSVAFASSSPLSPEQRDSLRRRLERIYYEQHLLIRNQRADRSDLRHQESEFRALKVFERIPFRDDLEGLKDSLLASARDRQLKPFGFKAFRKSRKLPPPVPSSVVTDRFPAFRLSREQLVERIPFEITVPGERAAVEAWTRSWSEDQLRLAELDSIEPRQGAPKRWVVRAHAFKFREVKFPSLEPRDPMEVLPKWARKDPDRFASAEPVLWGYVTRTRAIGPEARPLYRTREQLLLNASRMSFFTSLAIPRS